MKVPDPALLATGEADLASSAQVHVDYGRVGRALLAVCKVAALIGGLVFVGMVVMEIVSIVGRKLAARPVPGDVETLQMCSAVAAASFFAFCHMNQGDVRVDFFTRNLPRPVIHALDALASLLVGVFGGLLAWRTAVGALSLRAAGETSPILEWPLWIAQMLMVPGFVLLAAAGVYRCSHELARMRARKP